MKVEQPTLDCAPSGLRARKKAATQEAIERTAIAMAVQHGYENVTVEMICDAAMVSQRTFFNYFGSKEGVFLGPTPPMPTEADVAAFVAGTGSSVLGDLVETFTAALVDRNPDSEVLRARRTLIQSTPELARREITRISEAEDYLVQIVLARFHAQGRDETTTPDLADEARIVVSLAAGVMHYTMRKWFASDFAESPRTLLQNSINLIRRVTR